MSELKKLFIQSEINRVKERIDSYENMYERAEIKDLSLRRLIVCKQRELSILENIFN